MQPYSPPPRRRRLRELPLSRLFPNMMTLAGMCCGLSSIRFAMAERWEMAVGFLILAAIIDGMDGRIARMLNSTSEFGAQLDSLSDFVCFGVSPVLVLHMWIMHEVKGLGWAAVLLFAICGALRLARFNTTIGEEKKPWQHQFFTGVPAPAGAMLVLMPLMLWLHFKQDFAFITQYPKVLIVYVVCIGALMVSRIPTFSAKKTRIPQEYVLPVMLGTAFFIVFLLIEPWITIAIAGVLYLAMIPFSIRRYNILKEQQEEVLSLPGDNA